MSGWNFFLGTKVGSSVPLTGATFDILLAAIRQLDQYEIFAELLQRKHVVKKDEDNPLLIEELFRFLYLKTQYTVTPPDVLFNAWHVLLLLPVFYQKVSAILLKNSPDTRNISYSYGLIDHNPLEGDNQFAHQSRYEKCVSVYGDVFGETGDVKFWPKVSKIVGQNDRKKLTQVPSTTTAEAVETITTPFQDNHYSDDDDLEMVNGKIESSPKAALVDTAADTRKNDWVSAKDTTTMVDF